MTKQYLVHAKVHDENGGVMLRTAINDKVILLTLVTEGIEYDFELPVTTAERLITIIGSTLEEILNNGE